MDLMCSLNQTVGMACLATLLQFGVGAQSTPKASIAFAQEVISKLSSPSSTPASDLNKPLALASDTTKNTANNTGSDAKAETSNAPTGAEPKVNIKNPPLDLRVLARETRLKERAGTVPEPAELSAPLSFRATAYSLHGRTRLGTYVRRGVIAADPRVLPLGSVVQLKAGKYTGVYSVHDTGKKIKGKIVDVWMPSSGEARRFGRRSIKIHVLRLGQSNPTK